MKKRLASAVLAVMTGAAVLLTGCGGSSADESASTTSAADSSAATESASTTASESSASTTASDTAAAGGTVTIARSYDSNNLDPTMTADNVDIWVLNLMVEGLVASSDDGKEIVPAVADTWEISDDGLTYTFHIRDGIKFSDGNDVTVEDCIYSLDRAKNQEGPWVGMLDMIDTMEDTGDNNLKITLTETSPSFLSTLAMFSNGIMEKSYCESAGDEGIAEKPVGTGPFTLEEWDKGEKMVFKKNPYYWEEGCPKVDEIDMVVVADDSTRIMQLQSGQIDVATMIPFSRISELQNTSGVNVEMFDSTETTFVILNCQGEYTKDEKVRDALKLATDKNSINEAVYFGYGSLAETFLSPSAPHYDENLPATEQDLDQAKELLSEAGYPDGFEITVEVGSGNDTYLQIATMLQDQWKEIGVTLNINQIDTVTARQNWKDGNYDVFISGMTSDMTDTSELAGLWTIAEQANCWRSYWNGDEKQVQAEEYCRKANSEMDEEARMEDYAKMQEIVADGNPLIPLVYIPYPVAMSDRVSGFVQNPLGVYNLKNMSIAQ